MITLHGIESSYSDLSNQKTEILIDPQDIFVVVSLDFKKDELKENEDRKKEEEHERKEKKREEMKERWEKDRKIEEEKNKSWWKKKEWYGSNPYSYVAGSMFFHTDRNYYFRKDCDEHNIKSSVTLKGKNTREFLVSESVLEIEILINEVGK